MKTLLRSLLYIALIVWMGAEIFFPVIAAVTFNTLLPDTHTAGTIVGHLLRILHGMGLVSGIIVLALLDVLKEELFAIESEKIAGTLSASDYAEQKTALETVLRRALKKSS